VVRKQTANENEMNERKIEGRRSVGLLIIDTECSAAVNIMQSLIESALVA